MKRAVEAAVFIALIVGGAWYATVTAWLRQLRHADM